jgi:transcriptional regulator with XRE-family HTH domain
MAALGAETDDALVYKVASDFIALLARRLEKMSLQQVDLADRLGVTEGAVCHVLNHPRNLTLSTIAKYARALGMKVTIVGYDGGDAGNEMGRTGSEVCEKCWEHAGKPAAVNTEPGRRRAEKRRSKRPTQN